MAYFEMMYRSKRTGDLRTYRIQSSWVPAVQRLQGSLRKAGKLTRYGRRWSSGPRGKLYQDSTVQQLVAAGKARIDGDTVRPA